MRIVGGFAKLRELFMEGTRITDAGLEDVGRLSQLQCLDLATTRVNDAGLARLTGLRKLTELNLRETRVTDAGVAHLAGLTSLESLDLSGTKVSDNGMVYLKGLSRLQPRPPRCPNYRPWPGERRRAGGSRVPHAEWDRCDRRGASARRGVARPPAVVSGLNEGHGRRLG